MNYLKSIAEKFIAVGKFIAYQELGEGNINQTFLISVEGGLSKHFILQKINTQIFPNPEQIMNNLQVLTNHTKNKLKDLNVATQSFWQVPQVLWTCEQENYYRDENKGFWRAISFIENAQSYNTIQNAKHAQEIGYGLGFFHNLISDLDVTQLSDTLPGFHITPNYLQQYEQALNNTDRQQSKETDYCQNFIQERADLVYILEVAKEQGILLIRPIHGDPKINNIMIDKTTHCATAMIDLDTVKPGLIHYDIGDCLRSSCNVLGEETEAWEKVNFDLEVAEIILRGYLTMARNFLLQQELEYIYESIHLITFELGLRFFTDYLNRNIYFKTNYPTHNLSRALVQFQLVKSIESQEKAIKNLSKKI